jgi:small subunit ribosomal protein S16
MVTIRLSRGGARGYPFYHLVVTDSRNRRDGRYIERLGFFRPVAVPGEESLRIDVARADYWIGQGAQPSERVAKLLDSARKGDIQAPKTARSRRSAADQGAPAGADRGAEPSPAKAAESGPARAAQSGPAQAAESSPAQAADSSPAEAAGPKPDADAAPEQGADDGDDSEKPAGAS